MFLRFNKEYNSRLFWIIIYNCSHLATNYYLFYHLSIENWLKSLAFDLGSIYQQNKLNMSSTIKQLENLLNYSAEKNKIIAKNISNISTENYRREDIVFKNVLDENSTLKTSNEKHLPFINMNGISEKGFEMTYDDSFDASSGVNNISIEREMSELAENTLRFKFAAKKVSEYYKNIQNVIKGGGRGWKYWEVYLVLT